VTTDTAAATFTCAATSAGGTTTLPATLKRDSTPPTTPVFAGIAPQSYPFGQVPPAAGITCAATDPTSAVSSCVVAGYGLTTGPHTLTATATNGAGLTSVASLTYTMLDRLAAISTLKAPKAKLKVADVIRSGLSLTLTVASPNTKLNVTVTRGGKTVATQAKTIKQGGTTKLRVRLSRAGRKRLKAHPGALKVKVTGRALNFTTTTLKATVRTK
jgi:hypothetical protein